MRCDIIPVVALAGARHSSGPETFNEWQSDTRADIRVSVDWKGEITAKNW